MTFVETINGYVVIDVFREKLQYPDLKRAIGREAARWGAAAVLIEDKASGQSLIQDLRAETKLPIIAVMPKDDKLTRLAAVSPMIEAGKVLLFREKWNDLLVSELLSFPNGKHDDMVDALSQFLNWKRTKVSLEPRIRGL